MQGVEGFVLGLVQKLTMLVQSQVGLLSDVTGDGMDAGTAIGVSKVAQVLCCISP